MAGGSDRVGLCGCECCDILHNMACSDDMAGVEGDEAEKIIKKVVK